MRTKRLTAAEAEAARALGYEVVLCSKHGAWVENESGCPGCLHEAVGIPWPGADTTETDEETTR